MKKLVTWVACAVIATIVYSCSEDTSSNKITGGGTSYTGNIDIDYPNMKVGIKTFIARQGSISQAEKNEIIERLARIRALFNTKEFEEVVRGNWKEFNKYDEGSLQTIQIGFNHGQPVMATDYFGGPKDGKPDGGCSKGVNGSAIKPCGSMVGFNMATNIYYFLSERDQKDKEYEKYPYYNAPFAQKGYKDLLDEERMIEIFKKANIITRIEKQEMGTAVDLANEGPYRYLMKLDDPAVNGDIGTYIALPNKDWTQTIGGNTAGVLMHGLMHNLGFNHVLKSGLYDFGTTISPVTAISQYVTSEEGKLARGEAPYDKPEIQEMYKKIKDVYMQRYSGL